ncbi:putative NADPH--hemoprotein reductase [Helianthus anomalus]
MLGWQNNGLDSQSTTDTSAEPPIGVFFAYVAPRLQPDTTLFLPFQIVYEKTSTCRVHKGVCSTWKKVVVEAVERLKPRPHGNQIEKRPSEKQFARHY